MHTNEEIEKVVNEVTDEFNQTLNDLSLTDANVITKLVSLYGKVASILKDVIQERSV